MSSITVNQKNKSIVINSKGSTSGSMTLAGAATGGETVNEMFVTDMFWSIKDSAAHWEIDRGANTVLTVHGNGKINLQEQGLRLEAGGDSASTLNWSLVNGTDGHLVVKLHKVSA